MEKQENKFRKLGKKESIQEYCDEEESYKALSTLSKDDLIERYIYRRGLQFRSMSYIIMILCGMLVQSIILILLLFLK